MLWIHILSALFGLTVGGFAVFRPSDGVIKIAYGLVGLTLASGTYLVISRPVHIVSACLSGILYIGVTSLSLHTARRRLALAKNT